MPFHLAGQDALFVFRCQLANELKRHQPAFSEGVRADAVHGILLRVPPTTAQEVRDEV